MTQVFRVKIDQQLLEVELLHRHRHALTFRVNGKEVTAEVRPHITQLSTTDSGLGGEASSSALSSADEIRAPFAGAVSQLMCTVGDVVTPGMTVAVIEAMKMENPIKCLINGTITATEVEVGAQVKKGAVLVRIKEDKDQS